MADVTLKQLVKEYPGEKGAAPVRAVRSIDLAIRDGEFMVFVGPSGCGKSTTLRMIAGLESISGGEVHIGNRCVNDVAPKDRDIAMVFQSYALYPHKTVYANMAFGLEMMGMPKNEVRERVEAVAQSLGLVELLERKPSALSGGQRQRVALGRAIARQPSVFLFDEPLSNLDAKMRVSTRLEISNLHKKLGATMIYVTHDQVEAMTMGTRICVMRDGEIMQLDDPVTLYNQPQNMFVAGFIGSPPMNFIRGRIAENQDGMTFTESGDSNAGLRFQVPEQWVAPLRESKLEEVVFGIRPECICKEGAQASSLHPFEARIEQVEPMGAETYLYLKTEPAGNRLIARVDTKHHYKIGADAELSLQMDEAHFFDPTSEAIIGRRL
jgi:multiple sugar transport system ATP-binding protein